MRYSSVQAQPFVFRQLFQIIKAVLFFAGIMMLARFVFIGLFTEILELKTHLGETFAALFLGFRYDLIPLAYISLIPFLVTYAGMIFQHENYMSFISKFNRRWFFLSFLIIISIIVADYGFYSYFQDHINILFFGLWEDDTQALLVSVWKNYPVIWWGLLLAVILIGFWWALGKLFAKERIDLYYAHPKRKKELSIYFLLGLILIAFLGRGNFTRLPLSIEDAHLSSVENINRLSINGIIALNRAIKIRRDFGSSDIVYLNHYKFSSLQQAFNEFTGRRNLSPISSFDELRAVTPILTPDKNTKPHVVIFIMESFGNYWAKYQTKNFNFLGELDKHANEDFLFSNILPGDNGTIGSTTSLMAGLPLRVGSRFLSEGEYMQTPLKSASHIPFTQQGYDSRFIYGGKLGWRNIGRFASVQGFKHIEGSEDIKQALDLSSLNKESNIGNEWGIFDEHLIKYVNKVLTESQTPQFIVVLSTTNHPPFEVPSNYKPLPLTFTPDFLKMFVKSDEEVMNRFKCLQYSNQKLGEFLTGVKGSALKDKTIVAVTGDHSFWMAKDVSDPGAFRRYTVPLYFYFPSHLRPAMPTQPIFGSHMDILPTLYNVALSEASYIPFGRNLFDETSKGISVNPFVMVGDASGVYLDPEKFGCWQQSSPQTYDTTIPCEAGDLTVVKNNKRYYEAVMSITDEFLRKHR